MSTHRLILRSSGIIGSLTALSRILGFIRDLIIAALFGTSVAAEAFVVSFRIPNALRDLVGEGATNSSFVPVLTECREKKPEDFWRLVSSIVSVMAVLLLFLAAAGVVFAPSLVRVIAPGFYASPVAEKYPLTVQLTRLLFPYIFLIGLSAVLMGVLNSLQEFTSSAFGPCLLNLSMIAAGLGFAPHFGPAALVIGVLAGGVLQLLFQVPPLLQRGFRWMRPDFRMDGVLKAGRLLIPRVFGSALYQMSVFVDSILASFDTIVGVGGQSALYYSNRLFQLPLAVFGISLAQAVLPTLSSRMARNDVTGLKETLSMALRTVALLALPASVGLGVLAEPIIRIIFQRGTFDAYSTGITSSALFFYSFGLLAFSFIKILANAFYSMQDTRTPVRAAAVSLALNVVFCLLLMRPLKIGGLALASTLSASVNAALLYYFLRKRIGPLDEKPLLRNFFKMLGIAAAMGFLAAGLNHFWLAGQLSSPRWIQLAGLGATIAASIGFYFGTAYFLRIEEFRKFFS